MKYYLQLILIFSAILTGFSQSSRIFLDGTFDDWNQVAMNYPDANDNANGIDLEELSLANDASFLYIKIKLNTTIDLTDDLYPHDLWLYFDIDQNEQTGFPVQANFGSELGINFRGLYAWWDGAGNSQQINFSNISLRVLPTVTSDEFELAIARDALPDGQNALFSTSSFNILLFEKNDFDRIPNENEIFSYTFNDNPIEPIEQMPIGKLNENDIRVIFYNTLFSGLNDINRLPHFKRIIQSLQGDIYAFSEVWDTDPEYVKNLMDEWLPTGSTGRMACSQK